MLWLAALASAALFGASCDAAPGEQSSGPATAPDRVPILTQRQDGRVVALQVGATATLRVHADGRVQAQGRAVQLVQVDYFADPGYREWELHAERAGTTVIRGPRTDGGRFTITLRITSG